MDQAASRIAASNHDSRKLKKVRFDDGFLGVGSRCDLDVQERAFASAQLRSFVGIFSKQCRILPQYPGP